MASSPQQRALETAEIMAAEYAVRLEAQTELPPILVVPEFQERNAGPWSGLTREEIEDAYPGFLELDQRPDGYESDESLLTRTLAGLETVNEMALEMSTPSEGSPERVVVVFCHGGVINNLQGFLGVEAGRVPNLSGRVVCRVEDRWVAGKHVFLLDEEARTGGDSNRV